ncbi:hypothetical protein DOTSEDRAFT_22836 [Dothistroma septosporum NZE10]|uniref:Uncharacterized protein n=1 Tax=Dothistroma septosporum (strain NZE10 / CBS 128990) TaxID=675120 RepID=N1PWM5_DOTSN|nr:hypothetical protein DOTSEDRAFT_22836 [Dothistroma septosporum NZE10]
MEEAPVAEEKYARQHTHFFDLPQECRDMVYLHFRPFAYFDITQQPAAIHQPSIAKVSKRVRRECLDVFYGGSKFMLDMRGWKHSAYPKAWTPNKIFEEWVESIGDENTARLRNVWFYLNNSMIAFTIRSDKPRITFKFKQTRGGSAYAEIAEDAPTGHTFKTAMERARQRLEYRVQEMADRVEEQPLTVKNFQDLCVLVEDVKPTLCTRIGVGWKGAVLDEDPSVHTDVNFHRTSCTECGYYRIGDSMTSN